MANRYWRGGAGTWNSTNTANWSDQSGGLGGFSVPTSADDVFFDSASNATSYTVTTSGNTTDMVCRSLNVTGPATGTLTFSNTTSRVNIFGSLTHAATGVSWGANVTLQFSATTTENTITSNGFSFTNTFTFDGIGGAWALQDNLTITSNRSFTLINGSVNLNDKTLTCGLFSTNVSNSRTLSFGTGKIVVSGNNTTVMSANASNLTVSGSRRVEFSYAGATGTRTIGLMATVTEATALDCYILGGTDIVTTTGNLRGARNLDFTGFAGTYTLNPTVAVGIYGDLTFSAGMTLSAANVGIEFRKSTGTQTVTTNGKTIDFPIGFNATGTIAFQDALTQGSTRNFTITNGTVQLKNGVTSTVGNFLTSGTNQKFLQSTTLGSQATLSEASGTVNASYLTIRDINATGGATWNAYTDNGNIDAGNVDGWDFGISPVVGGAEYTYTIRSFTQPRRF